MHAIVLVTKLPSRGLSKTRLYESIGADGAYDLSKAMLRDLIINFSINCDNNLRDSLERNLYVPSQFVAEAGQLLAEIASNKTWRVMPMSTSDESPKASYLGDVLSNCLRTFLHEEHALTITFIGSDCPHLSASEWARGRECAAAGGAYICPAADGGYVLLTLPGSALPSVFQDVMWSSSETCDSQVRAIKSTGLGVTIGPHYSDIDNGADIETFLAVEGYIEKAELQTKDVDQELTIEPDLMTTPIPLDQYQCEAYKSNCPRTRAFFSNLRKARASSTS